MEDVCNQQPSGMGRMSWYSFTDRKCHGFTTWRQQ